MASTVVSGPRGDQADAVIVSHGGKEPDTRLVIRVKRRRSASPAAQALVLFNKRRKIQEDLEGESAVANNDDDVVKGNAVFKLAATLDDPEGVVRASSAFRVQEAPTASGTHRRRHGLEASPRSRPRSKPRRLVVGNSSPSSSKERLMQKHLRAEGRYKVLEARRGDLANTNCGEVAGDGDGRRPLLQVLDLEHQGSTLADVGAEPRVACNGVEMVAVASETEYVYDVYCCYATPNQADLGWATATDPEDFRQRFLLEDGKVLGCNWLEAQKYLNDPADWSGDDGSSCPDEDSDSNDENNWRNDYPDEDDDDREDDDDDDDDDEDHAYGYHEQGIGGSDDDLGMGGLRVVDSEEDGDDDLIHSCRDDSMDDPGSSFRRTADHSGTAYARFKRTILRQQQNKEQTLEDSEEDTE